MLSGKRLHVHMHEERGWPKCEYQAWHHAPLDCAHCSIPSKTRDCCVKRKGGGRQYACKEACGVSGLICLMCISGHSHDGPAVRNDRLRLCLQMTCSQLSASRGPSHFQESSTANAICIVHAETEQLRSLSMALRLKTHQDAHSRAARSLAASC